MLTIGKLGNSVDQLGYYEQQVAQGLEDYFSGRGEAPGRWVGRGARLVGAKSRRGDEHRQHEFFLADVSAGAKRGGCRRACADRVGWRGWS